MDTPRGLTASGRGTRPPGGDVVDRRKKQAQRSLSVQTPVCGALRQRPVHVKRQPRVLVVYEQDGWVFERIARRALDALVSEGYVAHAATVAVAAREPLDYDAYVFVWWGAAKQLLNRIPASALVYLCVYDHFTWKVHQPKAFLEVAQRADRIFASNQSLELELRQLLPMSLVCYMADGVDFDLFHPGIRQDMPLPAGSPLRVGWAGNAVISRAVKRLHLLQEAAARVPGIELVIADRGAGGTYVPYEGMADWYRELDLIACVSSSEGTPNPVLEGAATGLAVISTDVGIVSELWSESGGGIVLRGEGTVGTIEAALREVVARRSLVREWGASNRATIERLWGWDGRFAPILRSLSADMVAEAKIVVAPPVSVRREPVSLKPKLDLSDLMTVFIISTGEPDLNQCVQCIEDQDSLFKTVLIENVAPMDAAFQRMIDSCTTPYYIQVDADMLLKPNAVRELHADIVSRPPNVPFTCHALFDEHLGQIIIGVKCYRHSIMKDYPYQSSYSCEMDQISRLRADGHESTVLWPGWVTREHKLVRGVHGRTWTPERIFIRYKRLFAKSRIFKYEWVDKYLQVFLDRLVQDPSDLNVWAYTGAVAGLVCSTEDHSEQDCRKSDPDFGRLSALLQSGGLLSPVVGPGPVELIAYLTDRCQLACDFCKRQVGDVTPAGDLSPAVLEQALTLFPTVRSVCLAGFGEPLLSPNFISVCDLLRRRGLMFSLITNGVELGAMLGRLSAVQFMYVSVSLNAATAEEYKSITGTDHFSKVLSGVRQAVRCIKNMRLSFVVGTHNYRNVPDYIKLAESLGVRYIDFVNVLPHSSSESDSYFDSRVITDTDTEILAFLHSARLETSSTITLPVPISAVCSRSECASAARVIGLDAGGFVSGCRRVMPPSAAFGNISQGASVWNSPEFARLRKGVTDRFPCNKCFGNWVRS